MDLGNSKGTTINDLGGAEEIEKEKFLAALLRGKKFFGGHSPGKLFLGSSSGEKKILVEKFLRPPPDH